MRWSKPLAGLVALALVGLTAGALGVLAGELRTTAAAATVAVVVGAFGLAVLVGSRTGGGLSTPYW